MAGSGRLVSVRTHSWYSLLEAVHSPAALLECAAARGCGAVALTDTNSAAGAVEFVEAAARVGVRPVLGARLAHGGHRATALVAEPSGWRSLCRAISRLHLAGEPNFPGLLADCAQGLHYLVGDPQLLRSPLIEKAAGRLWVEVVRPGVSPEREAAVSEAGSKVGAPPVASLACRLKANPTVRNRMQTGR
jgi:hypothetical protein